MTASIGCMSTDQEAAPDWVESLSSILEVREGHNNFALSPLELAAELTAWSEHARKEAWNARVNFTSLLAEIDSTRATYQLGTEEERLLETLRTRFLESEGAHPGSQERVEVVDAARALRAHLVTTEAVRDEFARLAEAAKRPEIGSRRLLAMRDLLDDQLRERGADPHALMWVPGTLQGTDPSAKSHSLESRLEQAASELVRESRTGQCVVWLEFSNASVNSFLEAGPVTFFEARWTVFNAIDKNGQEFPGRASLRSYLGDTDKKNLEAYHADDIVIARVDLGNRGSRGAYEDALALVAAFVDVAVARARGRSWRPRGYAKVVMDDDAFGGVQRFEPFDTSKAELHRAVGWELGKWAQILAPAITSGPLPNLLREALRLHASSSVVEEQDIGLMESTRETSQRTATAIDDQVMELVLSIGGSVREWLLPSIDQHRVHDMWQNEIGTTVSGALARLSRTNRARWLDLKGDLESRDGEFGTVLNLGRAMAVETELVSAFTNAHERETAARTLRSLHSSNEFDRIYEDLVVENRMTASRNRRVRNAIVHGNPATRSVVDRSRSYSRYCTWIAIDWALNAHIQGVDFGDFVTKRTAARTEMQVRFAAGEDWPSIWASLPEPSPLPTWA